MRYHMECENYDVEEITADNRRPGMPLEGYIVRYGTGVTGSRKYMLTFERIAEVDAFTYGIDRGIAMAKNNEVR